ncbi:MAG: tyrosine-type recombinase/integrase [Armatimonadota bacterium]
MSGGVLTRPALLKGFGMALARTLHIPKPTTPAQARAAALNAFYAHCESKNLAAGTLRFYRDKLMAFLRWMERDGLDGLTFGDLTPKHLRDFLTSERKRTSPAQARHCYTATRVLFKHLVNEGVIADSPLNGVDAPKVPKKLIPALSLQQVQTLLATCGEDFFGARDRAILLLLLDTGARAAELLSITTADVDDQAGGKLTIIGKGDKQREVFFGPTATEALLDYLRQREAMDTPALFVNAHGKALTYSGLAQLLRRRGKLAVLPAHSTHPHVLRHTFATFFLRNGGNVFALQRLLGHATLSMTERYLTLTGDDLAAAHRAYSPADMLPKENPQAGSKGKRR